MAADVAEVMEVLNHTSAYVMGISQGGMIAQWLAVDFPEKDQKLTLAVTTVNRVNWLESELNIGKNSVNLEILRISCWISLIILIRKKAIQSDTFFRTSWVDWGESKMRNELPFSLSLAWDMIALGS